MALKGFAVGKSRDKDFVGNEFFPALPRLASQLNSGSLWHLLTLHQASHEEFPCFHVRCDMLRPCMGLALGTLVAHPPAISTD
jgi:hypothetical protein